MKALFLYPDICSSPVGTRRIPNYSEAIATLAAIVEEERWEAELLHYVQEPDRESLLRAVAEAEPDLVLFHATCNQGAYVRTWADHLQEVFDGPVVCGGKLATFCGDQVLTASPIDHVVVGEGDEAMRDILRSFGNGREIAELPNVSTLEGGRVRHNPPRPLLPDLDRLPFPQRSIFDLERCFFPSAGVGEAILTRGCRFSCPYCCHSGYRRVYAEEQWGIRRRSVDNSIRYLTSFLEEYPFVESFWFWDDILPDDGPWFTSFCERYAREVGLPFGCLCHPELMDPSVAGQLRDAGCREVAMAIESGDPQLRREVLGRGLSDDRIVEAFEACRSAGLDTHAISMLGAPHETLDQIAATIRLNARVAPRKLYWTIFYPYPGTVLYDLCEGAGYLTGREADSYLETTVLAQPSVSQEEVEHAFLLFPYLVRLHTLAGALGGRFESELVGLLDNLLEAEEPGRGMIRQALLGWREVDASARELLHRVPVAARVLGRLNGIKADLTQLLLPSPADGPPGGPSHSVAHEVMMARDGKNGLAPRAIEAWDEWAATYDLDCGRLERINDELFLEGPALAGRRVLELGCGTGRLAQAMVGRGAAVTAVDLSPGMLAAARRRLGESSGVRLVEGDLMDLELNEGGFDVVLSAHTLHHLDLRAALSRMARWLAPGGELMVVDVVHYGWRDIYQRFYPRYLRRYGAGETLRMMARTNGLTGRLPVPHHFHRHVAEDLAEARFLTFEDLQRQAGEVLPGCRVERVNDIFASIRWRRPAGS